MTSTPALSYDDALAAILDGAVALAPETIALTQALHRSLAAPVISEIALPLWDNAGMDGYAVRRDDVRGARADAPVMLRVTGVIAAGADAFSLQHVATGCAARIMTGAPIPPGADAVVRIEDTDRGQSVVTINSDRDLAERANVRPRGEEIMAGSLVFDVGTTVTPTHVGVLASVGCAHLRVHRKARVTLLSGGDELVMLDGFDDARAGRRIVSSTSYALPALFGEYGAHVTVLPLVPDTLPDMTRAIAQALDAGCDLLVTTGGISVGEHDFTRDALRALGGEIGFWRARIRPGGPIGTGHVRGVRWLGLPGNPVSSMITGMLFGGPLIRRLGGHATGHHLRIKARMLDVANTAAPLAHFLRVVLTPGADGVLEARIAGPQGSNLLRTMAVANALLHVPQHTSQTHAGDLFDAIPFPGALWQMTTGNAA